MSVPSVSVLVLTYNQADCLGRALESVLTQRTTFGYEVIIADDCSSDNTVEVAQAYAARYPGRVTVIRREKNLGVVDNYFDALSRCKGEFIADCAGDDRWHSSDVLQSLYDSIAYCSDVTVAHGAWNICREGGVSVPSDPHMKNLRLHQPVMPGRMLLEAMLAHVDPQPLHLSASLYRVSVIRRVLSGKEASFVKNTEFGCEDLPVICALLDRGMVAYVNKVILDYTVGSDTISNPDDLYRKAYYAARSALTTVSLARYYGVVSDVIRRYIRRQTDVIAGAARRLRNKDLADLAADVADRTGISMSVKACLNIFLSRIQSR